jgi:hypothetical protein
MNPWVCSICGSDTSNTDYDYLVNYDHISCHLGVWGGKDVPTNKSKLKKPMKIKNWDKISGFTYKGYTCVNPIHNATGECYYADVLNLNLPQKPKWHLELMIGNGYSKTTLALLDGNGINMIHNIELVDIRTVSLFRVRYEEIIDEMLKTQILSAPTYNSHSINTAYSKPINPNLYGTVTINNSSNGILNTIASSGTNIVVSGNSGGQISQYNLIDTIKELQRQIDELKLHTPTNPF